MASPLSIHIAISIDKWMVDNPETTVNEMEAAFVEIMSRVRRDVGVARCEEINNRLGENIIPFERP